MTCGVTSVTRQWNSATVGTWLSLRGLTGRPLNIFFCSQTPSLKDSRTSWFRRENTKVYINKINWPNVRYFQCSLKSIQQILWLNFKKNQKRSKKLNKPILKLLPLEVKGPKTRKSTGPNTWSSRHRLPLQKMPRSLELSSRRAPSSRSVKWISDFRSKYKASL